MKSCPYCSAQNWDDARVCYQCGRDLSAWSPPPAPAENPEPTQPNRVHRAEPPPDVTQPLPNSAPQARYQQQPVYPTRPAPEPAPFYLPTETPPPPTLNRRGGASRLWPVYLLALVVVFACAGALAIWTLTSASADGVGRLGAQLSTGVANVFTAPQPSATPAAPALPAAPTPWPTFTPQPAENPPPDAQPTPTLDPTQDAGLEKLLSPECAGALDYLSGLSEQARSNPTTLLDSAWREELSRATAEMKDFCGSLDSASPVPGIVADARNSLDQANAEFDEASRLFQEGVDELRPAKLIEAGKHVIQAADHLNRAVSELREIGR